MENNAHTVAQQTALASSITRRAAHHQATVDEKSEADDVLDLDRLRDLALSVQNVNPPTVAPTPVTAYEPDLNLLQMLSDQLHSSAGVQVDSVDPGSPTSMRRRGATTIPIVVVAPLARQRRFRPLGHLINAFITAPLEPHQLYALLCAAASGGLSV